jgi:signal transduction histidine kinase
MARPAEPGYCAGVSLRRIKTNGDAVLAGALAALYLFEIAVESDFAGDRVLSIPVALLFAASLAFRRRAALAPLVAGLGVIELSNLAAPALAETGAFLFGYVFAIYSAGRHARGHSAWACGFVILAAIPLAAFEPGQEFTFADLAFFVMFSGGPWAVGRVIRYRSERERDLEGRAAELELERETKAREAVVEERGRIARELHDVVAHAISVIVLQARGGRRMLGKDPADTRAALDTIERTGEQALGEMRRLLGMLRQGDEELALAPQPSLTRIDELVARLTSTGLPVDVTIEGEPVDLPPGIDVSAYRIVQEALTNALKHAGPARAHVILRYSAHDLELEIRDNGPGTANGGGSGYGLEGIRERVAVYGGELESRRRPEGGYALRARLPLTSAR